MVAQNIYDNKNVRTKGFKHQALFDQTKEKFNNGERNAGERQIEKKGVWGLRKRGI